MAKIALICVLAIVCLQLATATPRVVRDAPDEKKTTDVSKEIDEAINVVKNNFDTLLKNLQDNDMLKDLNVKIQKFGAEIAAQGKQIADKIQNSAKTE